MWSNRLSFKKQKGQSLVEVLVVLVIAAVMVIALIMIILASLKNAQFAQNQTQATKLAQDTIDKIRILRDKNSNNTLANYSPTGCFRGLWDSAYCRAGFCYYKLMPRGDYLDQTRAPSLRDQFDNGFSRQIKISPPTGSNIKLIVEVFWADSSGEHSSNLETVLTKVDYTCAN